MEQDEGGIEPGDDQGLDHVRMKDQTRRGSMIEPGEDQGSERVRIRSCKDQ